MSRRTRGFSTRAIHGLADAARGAGPVATVLDPSTTWRWSDVDAGPAMGAEVGPPEFYRRYGSPNAAALESRLAELEGAERALAVGSGMVANTAALMAVLPAGGHLVCGRTVYGEVANFLGGLAPRLGITTSWAAGWSVDDFEASLRPETRAIFVETPANPTLDVVDLAALGAMAERRGVAVVCDATLATPYNVQPLRHGCALVTHSATKYLGGHSDAMGGVVAGSAELVTRAWQFVRVTGGVIAPFDAWLIERGLRTLALRMDRIDANARAVVEHLRAHPAVARVWYPRSEGAIAEQYRGFGGVLSVALHGGVPAARRFVGRLRLFSLATSLGGVESLVQFPASMARIPPSERARLGVPEHMIRLAVGCEDAVDLCDDLDAALAD